MRVPFDSEKSTHLDLWAEIARSAYWWWPFEGICIISDRPSEIHWEKDRDLPRLHNVTGPALRFRDGWDMYCIRGVLLPRAEGVALTSGAITAQEILNQSNAEVRRVLVETYNQGDRGRWIRDLGARPIHTDVDLMGRPRRLFKIDQPDDEPYVMLEIVNWTPEPDGHRKVYQFRVHPELRPAANRGMRHSEPQPQVLTCQNALASKYGCYGHEYRPVIET